MKKWKIRKSVLIVTHLDEKYYFLTMKEKDQSQGEWVFKKKNHLNKEKFLCMYQETGSALMGLCHQ